MSELRPIAVTDNDKGQVVVDWTQVPDNTIRYDTDDEEEVMKDDEAGAGGTSGEAGGEVKKVVMDPSCTCCAQAKTVCKFVIDGNKKRVACVHCNLSKVKVLDLDEAKAGGSRSWEAGAERYLGLEEKLEQLIDIVGLIANNLVGLFKAHEAVAENSGRIVDALEAMLDESYGFGMVVSPSDLGLSKLDSDKLCEEAEWLRTHGKDEEEESEGEDESMAK
ncbi:hypothetical protein BKA82DRAFT_4355783 [Pisolithus tinctorius]|nr:hypothetical protein BKA82DRAFT_4355783 [Pisolithus tinctorius]